MKATVTSKWSCGCKAIGSASMTIDTAEPTELARLKAALADTVNHALEHAHGTGHTVEIHGLIRSIDETTHPGNLYYRTVRHQEMVM